MRLFVGDDWAEDHHDVEVMDETGKVLARKRLPEGVAGMALLHQLAGRFLGENAGDSEVLRGQCVMYIRPRHLDRTLDRRVVEIHILETGPAHVHRSTDLHRIGV